MINFFAQLSSDDPLAPGTKVASDPYLPTSIKHLQCLSVNELCFRLEVFAPRHILGPLFGACTTSANGDRTAMDVRRMAKSFSAATRESRIRLGRTVHGICAIAPFPAGLSEWAPPLVPNLFTDEIQHLLKRHRFREQVALRVMTAELLQGPDIFLALDSFGDDIHA